MVVAGAAQAVFDLYQLACGVVPVAALVQGVLHGVVGAGGFGEAQLLQPALGVVLVFGGKAVAVLRWISRPRSSRSMAARSCSVSAPADRRWRLWLLSLAEGPITSLVAATIWGTGVCFMWPTMLASVSERYPCGGSLMIGLLGSAGALSIYFVLPMLGAYYDQVKLTLAGGPEALSQLSAEALAEIQGLAAAESFTLVALLPLALLLVFGAIWLYDRRSSATPEARAVKPV